MELLFDSMELLERVSRLAVVMVRLGNEAAGTFLS